MLKYLCLTLSVCVAVAACESDSSDGPAGQAGSSSGAGGEAQGVSGADAGDGGDPSGGGSSGGAEFGAAGQSGEPSRSSGGAGGAAPAAECEPGDICFALDDEALSAPGQGYRLTHATEGQYLFVKYEVGIDQLSIEIYGLETGTYDVQDLVASGAARVAFYTFDGPDQVIYQGRSGTVTITKYTDDFNVTGTFEATLEKVVNDQYTGEMRSVTVGSFSDVFLRAI